MIIKVNEQDQVLGLIDKDKAHQGKGIMHRAFSILIFSPKGDLLIQKRSKHKTLWPLFWSNTCCSHPQGKETYLKAGEKRLKEEMGFICQLKMIDKFIYEANYKNLGWEKEMCAILVGQYQGRIMPNFEEVADFKWVKFKDLINSVKDNQQGYTPWFIKILNNENLRKYCGKYAVNL